MKLTTYNTLKINLNVFQFRITKRPAYLKQQVKTDKNINHLFIYA